MRKRPTQSRWSKLLSLVGALALLTTSASAQITPNISLQGDPKRPLTIAAAVAERRWSLGRSTFIVIRSQPSTESKF
jgi:hypothetical protein